MHNNLCSLYLFPSFPHPTQAGQQQSSESIQMRAVYKLGCRLVQIARNSQLDENGLRMFLKHLRTQYLSEITTNTDKQTIEE